VSRRRRHRGHVHGILVLDKPRGPTSHDLVALTRRALDTPSVGHAGTLDPMATGVLVLALGEATKLVPWLTADDKTYEATLRVGIETDSLDADGAVTARPPVPPDAWDPVRLARVRERFVGRFPQRAPAVSAIKRGGVALHARVRRGEEVEAPVRPVRVDALEILGTDPDAGEIRFRVTCGKGLYVRALGRDLAEALGSGGHLSALRRVRSGPFDLSLPAEAARAVDALAALRGAADAPRGSDAEPPARAAAESFVTPLAAAWGSRPRVVVDEAGAADVRHGRPLASERLRSWDTVGATPAGPGADPGDDGGTTPSVDLAVFDEPGRLLAVARGRPGSPEPLRVVRGFDPAASGAAPTADPD